MALGDIIVLQENAGGTYDEIVLEVSTATVDTYIANEVPTGTINGINDNFTLANVPTTGTVKVYVNGMRQLLTDDYSVSTNVITFTIAPYEGSNIIVDYNCSDCSTTTTTTTV